MILAEFQVDSTRVLINSVVIFLATGAAVMVGANALLQTVRTKEVYYGRILRSSLLLEFPARLLTVLTGVVMVVLGLIGYSLLRGSLLAMFACGAVGIFLPGALIRYLRVKRQRKLDDQLISAVQTLASGVRAGLNLVQAIQMIARDGPVPIRQEFDHLVREYEYGVLLDEAMDNAAERIGSPDFRLLFTALQTHRQRGGNLGETLDRINESIREIQRLESKVRTETARGRATARWLGAMPGVIMAILYVIQPVWIVTLFTHPIGNVILAIVVLLNVIGYLWIRKIMAVDI